MRLFTIEDFDNLFVGDDLLLKMARSFGGHVLWLKCSQGLVFSRISLNTDIFLFNHFLQI